MIYSADTISGFRRLARARGFTFVELMIGLTITAMVGSALAAFTFAMSKAWTDSGDWQALHQTTQQGAGRISDAVRKARYVGHIENGTIDGSGSAATYVLWLGNNGDDDPNELTDLDDISQLPEFAVLRHNKTDRTIELHRLVLPPETTETGRSLANSYVVDMSVTPDWLIAKFNEMNSAYRPRVLCRKVMGAAFDLQGLDTSDRPEFRFTLTVGNGRQAITENGVTAMRSPRAPD